MRQRCETLGMLVKWKYKMEKQTGMKIKDKLVMLKDIRTNSYNLARTLVLVLTSKMEYMGWLRKSTIPCWRRLGVCCIMRD